MRTVRCPWEGAALWVPKWYCPWWRDTVWSGTGEGPGVIGFRRESEVLPTQGPWDFLSWTQRNKKTNKIAVCFCSFLDHGNYFGSRKATLKCVSTLKCWIPFRPVASHLFSPPQCLLDFRQNVLQNVLEPDYNLIENSWGRDGEGVWEQDSHGTDQENGEGGGLWIISLLFLF